MKIHAIPMMTRSPFFEQLFKEPNSLCRMFICGDLNIGAHSEKDRIFVENVSKLSIIESSSIPLSSSQTSRDRRLGSVLSDNRLIIHSDSKLGPFVGFLKENNVFAYIPYKTRFKVDGDALIKCSEYPLMGPYNRIHTGILVGSFENRCCIINYWDLQKDVSRTKGVIFSKEKKTVMLSNYLY